MTPPMNCRDCGAPYGPGENLCWMCGRKVWRDPVPAASPEEPAAPAPPPKPAPAAEPSAPESAGFLDRWTQPILLGGMSAVITGLLVDKTGALLTLGLVPALLVGAISGLRPTKKKPEGAAEWAVFLLAKLASVVVIMILAAVAMTAALAMACYVIFAALSMHH